MNATAPPAQLRVNDVYTPEITRELAGILDAGCVINTGMDRNVLDLNRISQVRKRAPWFLELLTCELDRVIRRHGRVEVLFVHGWNTGRPTCDIGIGGREIPGGLQVPDGAHLAVGEQYYTERIQRLRAACTRAQIHAPVGERYPASHRNNLLQLFTPRAAQIDDPCAQRIATWIAQGRVNALQLEIGIPLRWPGMWRSRFVAAMSEAFAWQGGEQRVPPGPVGLGTQQARASVGHTALQFYDARADVGMFAGIGRAGSQGTAGRLLLFLGGQRIGLFTGEDLHATGQQVGPLCVVSDAGGMCLQFAGPMLLLDDAALYLDLEAALARSTLVGAEVQVDFTPVHGPDSATPQFGKLRGVITINGERRDVEAGAFANAGTFRASGASPQTMIAAAFGTDRALLSRVAESAPQSIGFHFTHAGAEVLRGVRVAVTTDGDLYTPTGFELACDGLPALRGRALSRMAILRPSGAAGYLRVTFGIARFEWDGATGFGLYEHARPVGGK